MPPPSFSAERFAFRDVELAYYRFAPPSARRGTLLLLHATGYSALSYRPLLERLRQAGYEVYALDFMGHGGSTWTREFADWNYFRDNALALLDHLQLSNLSLIGHSLGGASALLTAAADAGARIRRVVLYDPTVFTPFLAWLLPLLPHPLAKRAESRRAVFSSRKVVERSYRLSPAFRNWQAESFQGYLESALRERADGQYELSLPPAIEAQAFRAFHRGQWRDFKRVRVPTLVLQADPPGVCPDRSRRRLIRNHPQSEGRRLPGASHLFPFEDPERTAEETLRFLGADDQT
jgi:pimeloyl-ACP methyl ester carboxylesterase